MKKLVTLFCTIVVLQLANITEAQICMIDKFTLSATGHEYGIYANINTKNTDEVIYFDWETPNDIQNVKTRMGFKLRYAPGVIRPGESSANKDNKTDKKGGGMTTEVTDFISALEQSKAKFEEWSNVAKANNLLLLTRSIPVHFYDQYIYFSKNNSWFCEVGTDVKATFYVNETGTCYLVLESDEMKSNDVVSISTAHALSFTGNPQNFIVSNCENKIIEPVCCPPVSLTFSSSAEIDEFISKLAKAVLWKLKNLKDGEMLY